MKSAFLNSSLGKTTEKHYNGYHNKYCAVYSNIWQGFICKYMKWGRPDILLSDKELLNNKLKK